MKDPTHAPKGSIWAAGGVVWRLRKDGKPEYLLVHRPRYDDWSLPKGKLDRGERFDHAALREVEEETGITATLGTGIGTIAYETDNGNPKIVRYWLMEARRARRFKPNAEVDEIAWLRPKTAKKRLSYRRDREVLARAHELVKRPSSSRIFLVRHAHAGQRSNWDGPDRKRPLSKQGRKEAMAIRDHLAIFPITRIVTSKYLRCRQTVEPISKHLGVPLENESFLAEGTPPEEMIRFVRATKGESVVMCSHGDVIGAAIGLFASEGVPMHGPLEWEKGSVWVLEARNGRVVSARYIPTLL